MRNICFLLVLFIHTQGYGQDSVYFEMIHNVYNKNDESINSYNEHFVIKKCPKILHCDCSDIMDIPEGYRAADTVYIDDGFILKGVIWSNDKDNKCWGRIYVYGDIYFQSKDEKARISVRNLRYVSIGGKDVCPSSGDLVDFLNCKECKFVAGHFLDKYDTWKHWILDAYKRHLILSSHNEKAEW